MDEYPTHAAADRPQQPGEGAAASHEPGISYPEAEQITASEEDDSQPLDSSVETGNSSPYEATLGGLSVGDMAEFEITASYDDEPDVEPVPAEPTDAPAPAAETTQPAQPDRGAALQQLFDYAAVADDQVHQAVVEEVNSWPDGAEIIKRLAENGIPLDEAAEALVHGDAVDGSVGSVIAAAEQDFANLQYSDALAVTGLELKVDIGGLGLRMADPGTFASALGELPPPADPATRERLQTQSKIIINAAASRASSAVELNNPAAVLNALGGEIPRDPIFHQIATGPESASPENTDFAAQLCDKASVLSRELDRRGVPSTVIDPMRQLGIANQEGLTPAWGVGYGLTVIDHSDEPMGVDRLASAESWKPVYRYLEYLGDAEPNAEFTKEARATIVADLDAALNQPGIIGLPPTGDVLYDAEVHIYRHQTMERARPMLREAERRIRQILY
jgi:hypothetical protein